MARQELEAAIGAPDEVDPVLPIPAVRRQRPKPFLPQEAAAIAAEEST